MFGRNNILGVTNLFFFNQTFFFFLAECSTKLKYFIAFIYLFIFDNLQYIIQETTNKDGASSLQTTARVGERLQNLKQYVTDLRC